MRRNMSRKLYDWKEWFGATPDPDGRTRFVLRRGEHYVCSQTSMVQQLRVAATHCGVRVAVVDLDDRLSVVVAPKLDKVVPSA